jgi:spore cortex formation protein SpoVR/YcgB (stage V sporulation)
MSPEKEKKRFREALEYERKDYNPLWDTLPERSLVKRVSESVKRVKKFPQHPEENILYFLQKNAPDLPTWKRELIRIVRKTSQYFYPQGLTKCINEGTACMAHYHLIHKLYDEGYLPDGFMQEFFKHHSDVLFQPTYKYKGYYGLNPYTLGFNIFQDIKRMCENPTDEDRHWFPDVVGKDWIEQFNYIYQNFRDDSFVLQYLSPKVMRDMKLFTINDDDNENRLLVDSIHNGRGYRRLRESLSQMYNRDYMLPNIQVLDVDVKGDRCLTLAYYPYDGRGLDRSSTRDTLECVKHIWGYHTKLVSVDRLGGRELIYDLIQ